MFPIKYATSVLLRTHFDHITFACMGSLGVLASCFSLRSSDGSAHTPCIDARNAFVHSTTTSLVHHCRTIYMNRQRLFSEATRRCWKRILRTRYACQCFRGHYSMCSSVIQGRNEALYFDISMGRQHQRPCSRTVLIP